MDRPNVHDLFSRGSTPPLPQHQMYQPSHIESLFHGLNNNQDQLQSNAPPAYPTSDPPPRGRSQPDDTVSSSTSTAESALLSLLGSVSSSGSPSSAPPQGQQQTGPAQSNTQAQAQVLATLPGPAQRSGPSPNNNDQTTGQILLEQLMGNAPRSTYPDSQRAPIPPPAGAAAPSPPYNTDIGAQREQESYISREAPYSTHDPNRDVGQRAPQPAPQQDQPPSPSRKSMFDFVSPFDAISANPSGVKKKPPPQATSTAGGAGAVSGNEDTWASDPKRKSVENLMDQLTRGQGPPPPATQGSSQMYEPYAPGEELIETVQTRVPPPPLPPKPTRTASPRGSPPKVHAAHRPQPRMGDSPVGAAGSVPNTRKEKETPMLSRGSYKAKNGPAGRNKNQSSPSPQTQSIVFDVSQPLDEIQAPRDAVKSTAIALVRQESVFLPGTTIGATHWVAYAMTRGRVRVISRSSGDRTLLQLPTTFSQSAVVTDMAVYGNRLAGVTSDGGFVVWELPELITDDVPGQMLLCIPPAMDIDALHSVKWHPKQPDTLAVASESKIFLVDLPDAARIFRGQPVPQIEMHRFSQIFSVPSRLIAFDFVVQHYAIASISEDSTLTLWNIRDKLPFWSLKVAGDEIPSSLTFIDAGVIVGRKNGTIFQLLSVSTKSVLSTIKFVNGNQEDNDMFGHVNYDSRIQTLWVANSRRESIIAFRIAYESTSSIGGEESVRGYFEQVGEFSGPKSTIHFVILTADADPTGEEAHAACVAAKVPPGELALVAFSVHSTGVDQILIRREWFDSAMASAVSKFPSYTVPQGNGSKQVPMGQGTSIVPPTRMRTPPSEDPEGDVTRDETRPEIKQKGSKMKNVNWTDREREKKANDSGVLSDSALGQMLAREIRRSEESLHTRIGRLIGKEMDKQHHRFEDARAHEQAEDFTRQEKILKLISTELTRNTTRVVEMAVKNEVQNSVLPSLEAITKSEVKNSLNEQVGRGIADNIQQALPLEMEKLLLRPDISAHFARILSSNLTPLIERNIKEVVAKTFLPAYSQQSTAMNQELARDLRAEIHSVKKELIGWQNDAFRSHEALIRELEHSVRLLSDQVKFLNLNPPSSVPATLHHQLQGHNSPRPAAQHAQDTMNSAHMRQQNLPPVNPPPPTTYTQPTFQQQQQPPVMHAPWFGTSGIAAPQASHPAAPPPPPPPPLNQRTPPAKAEDWDETYLSVLGTQDARQLRDLLARSNPEIVMPLNGPAPLSQAVILTLLHRIAALITETPPVDESFKSAMWWLQRTATTLKTNDPMISPYVPRVVPNVQQMLTSTKQRLAILPGGTQMHDTARMITDIQDTLTRKP